jgi:hypothetical protein
MKRKIFFPTRKMFHVLSFIIEVMSRKMGYWFYMFTTDPDVGNKGEYVFFSGAASW